MRLSKTLSKLRTLPMGLAGAAAGSDRLSDLPPRPNPGKLRGRFYVPADLAEGSALVVVLHGCTQDAAGYDRGSGWSQLADRHGFALLFPEQARENNPNLCFNWFMPGDIRRGGGEPASIAAMIEAMCAQHPINRDRIFVNGLSAGGAMSAVMLATYPELFAAGAVIAGVAYGCAAGVPDAFEAMAGRNLPDRVQLGEKVRAASTHAGPWPRISVWHGSADHTVQPANAEATLAQWQEVHGLPAAPSASGQVGGAAHRVWAGPDKRILLEHWEVAGLGHGTPIEPGDDETSAGTPMPHMLDAGISSTHHIAAFFGVAPAVAARAAPRRTAAGPSAASLAAAGPADIIENALKAAGLMR